MWRLQVQAQRVHAAFEKFKLCRRSSTFANNKFDGYHLKSSTWECNHSELVQHLWKMPEKFDIYSKIFFRDVENFFWYLCELVLRHQMPVSNYFVNSFYSAMRRIFWGFCINRFGIVPLHYVSSRFDFGFKFAEIFCSAWTGQNRVTGKTSEAQHS